ncbi:MAG TPA: 2-phosphosulfolactate phosphatase [Planctomycetia bacterium]|jgi:2-phosphosulfolactate phosphatase|nr:2-phosphosulfolactate phosphatase [Planctomycetia bacterium]
MNEPVSVEVHLLPEIVAPERFRGGLAIVVDVLRATTTMVHALAAGCERIIPVATVEEARLRAEAIPRERRLLYGERDGEPLPGFDLGNSPHEFTEELCRGKTAVATTTNGTRAILHARLADKILLGAFVNFSAVCAEIADHPGPIHILCSGWSGRIALEDCIFAGAATDFLQRRRAATMNDSARLCWDAYEHHGVVLVSAFELSEAGRHLLALGYDDDVKAAATIDRFGVVPTVTPGDPTTIEVGAVRLDCQFFEGDSGLPG